MTTQTEIQETGAMTAAPGGGSLLKEILAEARLQPTDEGYDIARKGVQVLISRLAPRQVEERIDKTLVDTLIGEIDKRLAAQVNELLHHPELQALEAAWRSLRFLVERVDFLENIQVEMLSTTKDELLADFLDHVDVVRSGLYRICYSNEYGLYGGRPYGVVCGDFAFGPGQRDMELLRRCASVAAMAHAPFISNASPEFFNASTFLEVPNLKDLRSIFEGPRYARWRSFRDTEDARYVGLCLPRFLLRAPYGESSIPVRAFHFDEDVVGFHERYLWGYASTAFVTRVAESFARYRWSPNIIGPKSGGAVEGLPLHQYEALGELQTKIPTEILLTERREYELAEEGFISLVFRKDADSAAFFSANSAQKPRTYGSSPEAKQAELNHRLGAQLPNVFVASRLAHYLKVLQREQIGSWKDRRDLERELNTWLGQYVADMDDPAPVVRSRRPFRMAQVEVTDVEGQPGWYRCHLKLRPHFKYMGATFTLSIVGKLEKE